MRSKTTTTARRTTRGRVNSSGRARCRTRVMLKIYRKVFDENPQLK